MKPLLRELHPASEPSLTSDVKFLSLFAFFYEKLRNEHESDGSPKPICQMLTKLKHFQVIAIKRVRPVAKDTKEQKSRGLVKEEFKGRSSPYRKSGTDISHARMSLTAGYKI